MGSSQNLYSCLDLLLLETTSIFQLFKSPYEHLFGKNLKGGSRAVHPSFCRWRLDGRTLGVAGRRGVSQLSTGSRRIHTVVQVLKWRAGPERADTGGGRMVGLSQCWVSDRRGSPVVADWQWEEEHLRWRSDGQTLAVAGRLGEDGHLARGRQWPLGTGRRNTYGLCSLW